MKRPPRPVSGKALPHSFERGVGPGNAGAPPLRGRCVRGSAVAAGVECGQRSRSGRRPIAVPLARGWCRGGGQRRSAAVLHCSAVVVCAPRPLQQVWSVDNGRGAGGDLCGAARPRLVRLARRSAAVLHCSAVVVCAPRPLQQVWSVDNGRGAGGDLCGAARPRLVSGGQRRCSTAPRSLCAHPGRCSRCGAWTTVEERAGPCGAAGPRLVQMAAVSGGAPLLRGRCVRTPAIAAGVERGQRSRSGRRPCGAARPRLVRAVSGGAPAPRALCAHLGRCSRCGAGTTVEERAAPPRKT